MRKIFACILCLLLLMVCVSAVNGEEPEAAEYYVPEEGIVTSYYHIDRARQLLTGVAPGTAADQLLAVCLPGDAALSAPQVATGTQLTAGQSDTGPAHCLTVIVTGDLNGDGAVTVTDMLMVKSSILGNSLSDTAAAAGDINYDGRITITDFLRIKSNLLEMGGISAGRPVGTEPRDPMLLMTPDTSRGWQPGMEVSAFVSGDGNIATVDEHGQISAMSEEGSTFVYALDGEGVVLSRVMVTVLREPVKISLNQTTLRMQMGTTHALTPSFNHPVNPGVTWESGDTNIVTVNETGVLSAQNFGVATVTARLENGEQAQLEVTVAPPITDIQLGKSLYKVKPGNSRQLTTVLTPADTGERLQWTSSDPQIATVDQNGKITGVKNGTVTVTVTGEYSGLSASCKVKICNVKQVAMTFDDGPSDYTGKLLDFLKKNDIQVTFFVVGNRMNGYKDIMKREVAEGHEVGYHSYAHKEQTGLSSAQITADFEKSEQILRNLTGEGFTLWRTPGGGYNSRVLYSVPLPHIMWSVDTLDWKTLNTYSVYQAITNRARDGSIVLLHDLHRTSVDGAIMAMEEMLAGDYEFVTVTELLSRDGTPPANHTSYTNG